MPFEPKILAFLCTWCSYTGADTAGIARLKSPGNLRAVRVPCSGRVSPEIIMRAFDHGADGVLVLGCHIGECHYDSGNHRTAKRLPVLQALMAFSGLEPERLRLDWVSASEGERYSRITTEFTETVRTLGPAHWQNPKTFSKPVTVPGILHAAKKQYTTGLSTAPLAQELQEQARQLLSSGKVSCVIGYEVGLRGRTRPAFIYNDKEVERLVWNQDCTHNLTGYIQEKVQQATTNKATQAAKPVAVVTKACDARAINVQLAENRFTREQVHIIGVACNGIRQGAGFAPARNGEPYELQDRCLRCEEHVPTIYDSLIGENNIPAAKSPPRSSSLTQEVVSQIDSLPAEERMAFWLSQFDRCIRCYACRQACPMCDCPTCLYDRDDSLWAGMGNYWDEKRTFHLGRAYHLAGRCIGCDECERVCPMDIPISLLNVKLAQEMQSRFGHQAGRDVLPSPFVTILSGEEQ
jgi:coenzyme F420-reducing hydrogenase delta subunit/ferredoxin